MCHVDVWGEDVGREGENGSFKEYEVIVHELAIFSGVTVNVIFPHACPGSFYKGCAIDVLASFSAMISMIVLSVSQMIHGYC